MRLKGGELVSKKIITLRIYCWVVFCKFMEIRRYGQFILDKFVNMKPVFIQPV